MEFVPGEDLAQRLARGTIPTEDALDIAHQVAGALEAAHEQGVIHRDLKPANIKCTPEGKVKVLDLGLAKALIAETSGDVASVSMSPTVTSAGTIAGTLLGTAAYMSPEQAKGKPVDRRADIWAFGVVLHEMLTGRTMFEAETISETLAAVLRDEVSLDDLSTAIPAPVTALLKRCLDRDPQNRLRDIGEARIALAPESLASGGATPAAGTAAAMPVRGSGRERLLWTAAVLLLAAIATIGWTLGTRTDTAPRAPEVRASIVPPEGQRFGGNNTNALSISPDGTKVTFAASTGSGRTSLFLRALGATEARRLPGTEGATYPFWSPDNRWIAFFADGKLKKLDLDGGAPMTITPAPDGRGGTWGVDGTILYAPETQMPIHRVSEGGEPGGAVTTLDHERGGETSHRHPSFLPNGRHYLFLRASHHVAPTNDINSIWIGDLESGDSTELMSSTTQAVYAQGHIFWVRDRFLMARPFSTERLRFTGNAFAVGEGVAVTQGAWRAAFAVSEAGPLAFHGGTASERTLNIFDRDGDIVGTIGEEENYTFIRLSPDDRFLAATISDRVSGRSDLWIQDLQRNVKSRLTFHEAEDKHPVWSPDGKRIAFASRRDGKPGIFVRRSDGKGDAELLFSGETRAEPEDWSHDGKHLAYNDGAGKGDLAILSVDDGEVFKLVETEFDEGYARFSPDDRWIAYLSNESGRYDMYLTRSVIRW
jgi:Tol biopolymer transport system component